MHFTSSTLNLFRNIKLEKTRRLIFFHLLAMLMRNMYIDFELLKHLRNNCCFLMPSTRFLLAKARTGKLSVQSNFRNCFDMPNSVNSFLLELL